MAVLHDYKCLAHGYFEAWEARCPKGCDGEAVQKVFLQPVGLKSDSTKHNDKTLKSLATEYHMSDIKSTREGEAQPPRFGQQQENPLATRWGAPTDIGNYNTAPIKGESVNGLQLGKATGKIDQLRPSVVRHDHENLKIKE